MRHTLHALVAFILVTTVVLGAFPGPVPSPASAAVEMISYLEAPQDFEIPGGHFFKQANKLGGAGDTGFAVLDDDEAKFWSEFRRLGGVQAVGYPISRRFRWAGFTVQAFQRGVLQWRPDSQQAMFVNVFDLMHDSNLDDWLVTNKSTPKPLDSSFDAGKDWATIVKSRRALLDAYPAIKARYNASPDPMTFFGLPTSNVVDNGNHYAVRLQRAVLQQWKVDVPWAKAGQVTVANGGDIGAQAGFYPATGFDVEAPTYTRNGKVVVIDPGHGGPEVGSARTLEGGSSLIEKDLNLAVGLRAASYLAANGYRVVLTRNADVRVNASGKDITGDGTASLRDDLQSRIDIANNAKADVLVSIHFNGYSDTNLKGTAVHYSQGRPTTPQSLKLSQSLQTSLVQAVRAAGYTGLVDRGVQDDSRLFGPRGHLYLLGDQSTRPSTMPGALTETMFITSPDDAAQLSQPKNLQAVALGHAYGIAGYFGLPFSENPAVVAAPAGATPAAGGTTAPAAQSGGRSGKVQTGGQAVSLRTEPNTTSPAIRAVADGTTVTVLQGAQGQAVNGQENRWYKVTVEGKTGFIYAPLVVNTDPKLALPPPRGVVANPTGNDVNARSGPGTGQPLVQKIADETPLDVLDVVMGEAVDGAEARWYQVVIGEGTTAYIYAGLMKVE